MNFLNNCNLPFLAGLIEGDGFVGSQFKFALIDDDLIEWVASCLNTNVSMKKSKDPKRQVMYETSLGRKFELQLFYEALYPFFGKRRRAQLDEYFLVSGQSPPIGPYKVDQLSVPKPNAPVDMYACSPDDWAYIAGYFVAEGSIFFETRSKIVPYSRPALNFSSTDEDVIAHLAKLLEAPYTVLERRTVTNKTVFRISVSKISTVQRILINILPYVGVSKRHEKKVQKAIQMIQTRQEWYKSGGLQKARASYRQETFQKLARHGDPFESRSVEFWQKIAAIFQSQTFIFFVNVRGMHTTQKSPRLRIESTDKLLVEEMSELFQSKTQVVKKKVKSQEVVYRTQTEKKVLVYLILFHTVPFLTGTPKKKAEEALALLKDSGISENLEK